MKLAKKFASLLLALAMVFSLGVTASAAEGDSSTTGKITINNTVKDTSYSIYRIFDLESFSDDTPDKHDDGAYSYKVNSDWSSFFTEGAAGLNYVDVDENGYVTWKADADAAAFAKAAIEYAQATAIPTVGEAKQAAADNDPVVFEGLPLGYYLVDSSLGALCALTTTNPEATVIEKNANPTLTKEVKEGDDWTDKNDANVGDTVEFRATITVQGTAKDYVMHDQMDDGLTYAGVTKVTLNGDTDANIVDPSNYTVTAPAADGHTFDVAFSAEFCESLKSGDVIVVYYQATLNSNAVVKEPENNNAHLEYKDNSDETHKTETSNTKTFTWQIPVLKYENGNTEKPLANAKFTLYKTEAVAEDGTKTYSDPVSFNTTEITNTYEVAADGATTEITTDATGRFHLDGLDAGTYYLKEIEAPKGYNRLDTVVTVTIDHDGKINATEDNLTGATEIQVENKSGTELPSTGGMGTTIFYAVGGVLVLAAVVLLVTKKRMGAEK